MTLSSPASTGEHPVTVVNEHWVKYVVPTVIAILLFLISLLLFLLAGLSAHHTMWLSHATFIAGFILFLLTFHWFFMVLLSEALDCIIVTNRRLLRIQYRLLLREDILEISFEKMKTVDARKKGFIQNLLHYGTLNFENSKAIVTLVPHPNRIAHVIQEVMQST